MTAKDASQGENSAFAEILRAEDRLRGSFDEDAGAELKLADRAASLLTTAMLTVGEPQTLPNADEIRVPQSGDAQRLILLAVLGIGGRALRAIRAARGSLELGYEAESLVHDRVLIELWVHLQAVMRDPTGAEARAWLRAKRGRGIGKRVSDLGYDNLYPTLSANAHGDPRALDRMTNFDAGALQLAPKRSIATRASLILHASLATDLAKFVAGLADIELQALSGLHHAIRARVSEIDQEEGERERQGPWPP